MFQKIRDLVTQPDKVLDFPDGSVLIKTFAYLNDHPESKIDKQLLETRLLIKKNDAWKNVSYVWNEKQDDAYLSIAGKTINTAFVMEDGTERNVRYRVPNINQCKECHQLNKEIQPIGPKVRNLNHKFSYSDGTMNQIKKWQIMEWIDSSDNYPTMANWSNEKMILILELGHILILTVVIVIFQEDQLIQQAYI